MKTKNPFPPRHLFLSLSYSFLEIIGLIFIRIKWYQAVLPWPRKKKGSTPFSHMEHSCSSKLEGFLNNMQQDVPLELQLATAVNNKVICCYECFSYDYIFEQREKGICEWCGKSYSVGHKCEDLGCNCMFLIDDTSISMSMFLLMGEKKNKVGNEPKLQKNVVGEPACQILDEMPERNIISSEKILGANTCNPQPWLIPIEEKSPKKEVPVSILSCKWGKENAQKVFEVVPHEDNHGVNVEFSEIFLLGHYNNVARNLFDEISPPLFESILVAFLKVFDPGPHHSNISDLLGMGSKLLGCGSEAKEGLIIGDFYHLLMEFSLAGNTLHKDVIIVIVQEPFKHSIIGLIVTWEDPKLNTPIDVSGDYIMLFTSSNIGNKFLSQRLVLIFSWLSNSLKMLFLVRLYIRGTFWTNFLFDPGVLLDPALDTLRDPNGLMLLIWAYGPGGCGMGICLSFKMEHIKDITKEECISWLNEYQCGRVMQLHMLLGAQLTAWTTF